MPHPGLSAVPIVLSEHERAELVRRAGLPGRWRADRARIILACAEGMSNAEAARELGVAGKTGSKWRGPVPPPPVGLEREPPPLHPAPTPHEIVYFLSHTLAP